VIISPRGPVMGSEFLIVHGVWFMGSVHGVRTLDRLVMGVRMVSAPMLTTTMASVAQGVGASLRTSGDEHDESAGGERHDGGRQLVRWFPGIGSHVAQPCVRHSTT